MTAPLTIIAELGDLLYRDPVARNDRGLRLSVGMSARSAPSPKRAAQNSSTTSKRRARCGRKTCSLTRSTPTSAEIAMPCSI